ncbi:hypothetical protein [Kamptonema formosum]|uniref:hypothetical protein n=1 Tax=Kamptonema formosum TaxID=331992 RepID=UPI0003473EB6|nr:hypothetical protein [Oscillatoria sp. PCC 10802]
MLEALISLIILLWLGSFLVPVIKNLFQKDYGSYLGAAIALLIVVFFVLRLPSYSTCTILTTLWVILTFPLRPLGLVLVILLQALKEGMRKLEDDKEGKKAQDSRKKLTERVMVALVFLLLSSVPVSADWLADRLGQESPIRTGLGFVDYLPRIEGLSATTSVLEKALPVLYNPINVCPPPPGL